MQTMEIYKNYGVLGAEKNKCILIRRTTPMRNMQQQNDRSCTRWMENIPKPGRTDNGHGSMGLEL